jgi:hypothetical protein
MDITARTLQQQQQRQQQRNNRCNRGIIAEATTAKQNQQHLQEAGSGRSNSTDNDKKSSHI